MLQAPGQANPAVDFQVGPSDAPVKVSLGRQAILAAGSPAGAPAAGGPSASQVHHALSSGQRCLIEMQRTLPCLRPCMPNPLPVPAACSKCPGKLCKLRVMLMEVEGGAVGPPVACCHVRELL